LWIAGEEIVSYAKSGISEKMMNKMKRGHLDNISELDLHGYTIKQTCEALSEFIYREETRH
jgi:DNA-nicking Smr family endonuclease